MTIDYRISYREQLDLRGVTERSSDWSLLVSAFNTSERVTRVFDSCRTGERHWLAHQEYGFSDSELPQGCICPTGSDEAEFWVDFLAAIGNPDLSQETLCLDITGFMRPHLSFVVAWLFANGIDRFYVLYSDPVHYTKQERTPFSKGPVVRVRQVTGFEGIHRTADTNNDLVIIGAGYDDELIRRIAEDKSNARKVQLFGLPSLEPDMYQESVIRADKAVEAVGGLPDRQLLFAPANDPFVTAQVLSKFVAEEDKRRPISNLYLSSLGTKPQVLGFTLFFLTERANSATSLVFPYAESYEQETAQGLARSWLYTIERLRT
jgi:hypothetical protein